VSVYTAELRWERGSENFLDKSYSRRHRWRFDGGLEVAASASPQIVPVPLADPTAVDPEEAFVASLASCHLLWFLALACERGFCVESYHDRPAGTLALDADGREAMTVVTLQPEVVFTGEKLPSRDEILVIHGAAHERCFIANSVKTDVRCEPRFADG